MVNCGQPAASASGAWHPCNSSCALPPCKRRRIVSVSAKEHRTRSNAQNMVEAVAWPSLQPSAAFFRNHARPARFRQAARLAQSARSAGWPARCRLARPSAYPASGSHILRQPASALRLVSGAASCLPRAPGTRCPCRYRARTLPLQCLRQPGLACHTRNTAFASHHLSGKCFAICSAETR